MTGFLGPTVTPLQPSFTQQQTNLFTHTKQTLSLCSQACEQLPAVLRLKLAVYLQPPMPLWSCPPASFHPPSLSRLQPFSALSPTK